MNLYRTLHIYLSLYTRLHLPLFSKVRWFRWFIWSVAISPPTSLLPAPSRPWGHVSSQHQTQSIQLVSLSNHSLHLHGPKSRLSVSHCTASAVWFCSEKISCGLLMNLCGVFFVISLLLFFFFWHIFHCNLKLKLKTASVRSSIQVIYGSSLRRRLPAPLPYF